MIFYAPLSHFHDIFTGFVQRSQRIIAYKFLLSDSAGKASQFQHKMSTHEPNKVMETENQLLYWEKKESENTPKKFRV